MRPQYPIQALDERTVLRETDGDVVEPDAVHRVDLSKLVLGGFIVLMVVAFPKGIVGTLETIRNRWRPSEKKSALATPRVESAE